MAGILSRMRSLTHKSRPDAEFTEFRSRLEAADASLRLLKDHLEGAESAWKGVAANCTRFVEAFTSSYPDEDDMRNFSRETDRNLDQLSRSLTFNHDGKQWRAHEVVTDFLAEIASLDFKAVEVAQAEVAKYSRKLDGLRRARSLDEERVTRNEEKFEAVRAAHDRVLQPTVAKMREIWAKVPIAFTAMFVAYWHAQVRAAIITQAAFDDPSAFVNEHMDRLCACGIHTISQISLDELLKSLEYVPGFSGKAVKVVSGGALFSSPVGSACKTVLRDASADATAKAASRDSAVATKAIPTSPIGPNEEENQIVMA